MHIYAYGSVCRGDVLPTSDVDLLALVDDADVRLDPAVFSIYRYSQLKREWCEGNPFSWHLALESRLVFSEDRTDFIAKLGRPSEYRNWQSDSQKFREIYGVAKDALATRCDTTTFELSTLYLAIRNFAICFSLHAGSRPVFSRRSFEQLGVDSLDIDSSATRIMEDARILSTRGVGSEASDDDVAHVLSQLPKVDRWMSDLVIKGSGEDD